jgi:hypothetical protein
MTATAGPAIATYVAAEDALVAWMYRCRAGRMKMCDIWELLSFSAHQVQLHHEESSTGIVWHLSVDCIRHRITVLFWTQ